MALSSLLDIVARAADELGLDRPSVVYASSVPQVRQFLAAAQAAGRELMQAHEWGGLISTGTVSTSDGTSTYAVASDFDRLVSDTFWDSTNAWMLVGPDTPQVSASLNYSSTAQTSARKRFLLRGSNMVIWPTPTATETLKYAYVSNKWALSSGGTAQTEFQADTDTTVFFPQLMVRAVKWKFMAAKGMDTSGLETEYRQLLDQRIAADLGGSKLNMAPDPGEQFIALDNIAEANWSL